MNQSAKLAKIKTPIGRRHFPIGVFVFYITSKQNTPCVCNCSVAVVIGDASAPADLGHKKAITFHAGNCLVRKTAGIRIGALLTDPAATRAQT